MPERLIHKIALALGGFALFGATLLLAHVYLHARGYARMKRRVEHARVTLMHAYEAAPTEAGRVAALRKAGHLLTSAVKRGLLPYWIGTPYSFNGTTKTPHAGTIACGALVANVLRDVGLNLRPGEMTVLAAEQMIKSLVAQENIRRWKDVDVDDFLDQIKEWGPGLYQIGLDTHTGLLVYEGRRLTFVHATKRLPYAVVKENARRSKTLASSHYKIAGKLSADRALLEKWLGAVPILSPVTSR